MTRLSHMSADKLVHIQDMHPGRAEQGTHNNVEIQEKSNVSSEILMTSVRAFAKTERRKTLVCAYAYISLYHLHIESCLTTIRDLWGPGARREATGSSEGDSYRSRPMFKNRDGDLSRLFVNFSKIRHCKRVNLHPRWWNAANSYTTSFLSYPCRTAMRLAIYEEYLRDHGSFAV